MFILACNKGSISVTYCCVSGVLLRNPCTADTELCAELLHDDVIKWKHFPPYWPFVRGIHRSPVNSPHKGQWRGALMFSLICVWINGWANSREASDMRRYRAHYDVTVMVRYNAFHKMCTRFYCALFGLRCRLSLLDNSCESFAQILYGCLTGAGAKW